VIVPPSETARFYRIWIALLHYVNTQRQLVPPFPATHGEGTLPTADALTVRNALWADDALREQFVATNPAGFAPADLALVTTWRHRLSGGFFVVRYLRKHTVFLSQTEPAHAYGVLGLVSPLEEILGPSLPIYTDAVLLPFEDWIVYDSLLVPYAVTFGPGIRSSLQETYRNAQEREGVITTLRPGAPPHAAEVQATLRGRNTKLLTAFRKELARAGLSAKTVDQHVETIRVFAQSYLLAQEPPRGLLELTRADLHTYLMTAGRGANRTSFKRFVRFLSTTGRLDHEGAADLSESL
jgi:hypothetical protein